MLSSAAAPMPPGRHTFSRVRIRHKSLSVPLWLAALQGTEPGTITFFKNGETNSRDLPPSMLKEVSKGEKFVLATKPSNVGNQYWLVTLKT